MSDIKNVSGTGVPGGIDPTNLDETPDPNKVSRFKQVASRLRQEEVQGDSSVPQSGSSATQGATPSASDTKRELLRRALSQANLSGLHPQGAPLDTSSTSGVPNLNVSGAGAPGSNTPSASLRGLFGGGAVPAGVETEPNLHELFSGVMAQPSQSAAALASQQQASASVFTPTFQQAQNVDILTGTVTALNPTYFATPDTADWLVNEKLPQLGFPGATVIEKQAQASGGPFVANQQELWIQLPDGTQLNAGQLADYYIRNPENQFPNVADTFVTQIINGEMGKSV